MTRRACTYETPASRGQGSCILAVSVLHAEPSTPRISSTPKTCSLKLNTAGKMTRRCRSPQSLDLLTLGLCSTAQGLCSLPWFLHLLKGSANLLDLGMPSGRMVQGLGLWFCDSCTELLNENSNSARGSWETLQKLPEAP